MEQSILKAQAPRTALMKLLDGLLAKRFIYIHAPAGFGKTVSSLLWLEHREKTAGIKRAWVSLDEYDNKTAEFCKRFVTALASIQPENDKLNDLITHQVFNTSPVEFTLHALDVLTKEKDDIIVVLDDLHIIKNDEILKLIPILFKRLPTNFTILLISRTTPPDSLSEMVAKEELAVIDAGYLQFSSGEIKVFFDRNGRFLSSKQADEILASTGGWAIGIRALLMSDEKSYNIDLTGRYLESFLKEHVWERWDDRLRYFMTLVSVAEELTPDLCEYLIADEKILRNTKVTEMLAELLRENAFLRETGDNTYRFHDLFREFLLHMLEDLGEQLLHRQWDRIGDYFHKKEDFFRAVAYYTKGKNDKGVADSLYHMYDYSSSYASIQDTLYSIHLSVNDSIVEKYPFLLEVQIWAAYVEGRAEEFEGYLDRYYKLSPKIILKNPRSALILVMLRAIDYRVSLIRTLQTIQKIPFKGSIKAPTPSTSQNMPFFHRSFRDFSEYVFETEKNMVTLDKTVGIIVGTEYVPMKSCINAGLHYERGELEEAREHALSACANIPDRCSAEIMFCSMMILASTLYAEGQNAEAEKTVDDIRDMIEREKAYYLNHNLRAYMIRLRLTNGDIDAAKDWLKDNNGNMYNSMVFFKLYQYFTTARAHIVLENTSNAILFLKKLLELSERYRRTLDIIEARILLSIVYWKKGGHGQTIALDYLEQAILEAHDYGFIQVFANEGAELINMLQRIQKRTAQSNYKGSKVPGGFVKTLYFAAVTESKRSKGLTGGRQSDMLMFTDKQKEVMHLMCEGFSRNEIATKMGLKPNGVKSHITLIYKKLDVSNSIDAVLKIKAMSLPGGKR
ncbi:MAG: LuxR C-terminal-related transcriptional regulator [Oscillospiraceae bacterium]|nr:LuxR C-terminal-related transcriptional regulator [Oscillospiraceae bacterium]